MAERRARGGAIRDLSRGEQRESSRQGRPFLSPGGWLTLVGVKIALVILIGIGFVVGPPLLDCHGQSARGFFAGDSLQACAQRGIAVRFGAIDGHIRQAVLRSGQ